MLILPISTTECILRVPIERLGKAGIKSEKKRPLEISELLKG